MHRCPFVQTAPLFGRLSASRISDMSTTPPKPLLAVTMGDPSGIGPEIIAAAWASPLVHDRCRMVVLGNAEVLRRAIKLCQTVTHPHTQMATTVVEVSGPADVTSSPAVMPCLGIGTDDAADVAPGRIDARGGQVAYEAVVAATELALAGHVEGIVTAPISKAALWCADHEYPGHTELLAELCGVQDFAMMLYLPPLSGIGGPAGLGVVHVTLHTALRDAIAQLTTEQIVAKCRLADAMFRELKEAAPQIGVCALNPHASESGLFGDEERRIIQPAVDQARAEGLDVAGPLPADTLMVAARDGRFDAVVAMVHDQGHIAIKLLGMERAVNVTLGLPIVRTSVAHGTAADLAWKGEASCEGMIAALTTATKLVGLRAGGEVGA